MWFLKISAVSGGQIVNHILRSSTVPWPPQDFPLRDATDVNRQKISNNISFFMPGKNYNIYYNYSGFPPIFYNQTSYVKLWYHFVYRKSHGMNHMDFSTHVSLNQTSYGINMCKLWISEFLVLFLIKRRDTNFFKSKEEIQTFFFYQKK